MAQTLHGIKIKNTKIGNAPNMNTFDLNRCPDESPQHGFVLNS